jgi:magnesium-transporting ATPase (P-type)
MIPGDLRLIEAKDLFVNQSALTGEAMPAEKFAHAFNVPCGNAFDLSNICFMGANVVSGFATGVIVQSLFDLWVLSDKGRPHYGVELILRDVRGADNDHRSIR